MVEYCDRGNDEGNEFCVVARRPLIELNCRGEVETVNQHPMSRSSYLDVGCGGHVSLVPRHHTFHAFLRTHATHSIISWRMVQNATNPTLTLFPAGDILVMDNKRLLHGRSAFTPVAGGGVRHLEGGYWAWADVCSKRRVLQDRQQQGNV
ncbi:hypothetical protein Pmani_025071 [Petrolisthes manimaculis]|uniref:TauD/TfdA-like domain-containing protein n=1 Tax=Petrolisthes manimaculis TaxID=1843537 RepID=A0AAE1P8R3_9EUCA|nr:hypothetical protein Pmani_025071 [Petrolisthes manimaculis]